MTTQTLAPFGLCPSPDPHFVFESSLVQVAERIRQLYRHLPYDHRPDLPERDRDYKYLLTEEFRRGYACFKYAVAQVIQPATICEIGVGAGCAALAFVTAAPRARYLGIDDGSKDRYDNWSFMDFVRGKLREHGEHHEVMIQDSRTLEAAPMVDLFHVDGAHEYDVAYNDTRLAVQSDSAWILVDDTRDLVVASAALAALRDHSKHEYDWTHFEDTWTGSMLFRRRSV